MKYLLLAAFMASNICLTSAKEPLRLSPEATLLKASQAPRDSVVSAYINVDPSIIDISALEDAGVKIGRDLGDILTARVPIDAISKLASIEGVKYVQTASKATQMLDVARTETGIEAVHQGIAADLPYTGAGVVVGIIDSGFDYAHAAFRDADGNLRIKRVWEQGTSKFKYCVMPAAFDYGIEITKPSEIIEAGGDIRNNSHGSHVASIAAGSDTYLDGILRGMAPDADIVLVSMTDAGTANVNISDAIAYIFDYADEVGKPCVINLSLGCFNGPHDGTSTFDVIADRLQGPGRLIVGASGNNRQAQFHVSSSISDAPLRTFIDYANPLSESRKGGDLDIWADAGMDIEVALMVVKTNTNEVVERSVVFPSDEAGATVVGLGRNVTGSFTIASEISPLNGKTHILATSGVTGMRTGYALALEILPKSDPGNVDIWCDPYYLHLSSHGVDGYSDPCGSTLCEIGGTAKRILTVGAYTTRSQYTLLGESMPRRLNETDGDLGSFSGCGPTSDGRMKPQITAPGCFIIGAVSQYDASGTLSLAHYHQEGGTENYYGYMQGTSMASPMVAGIVATWLEAYPELTPEELVDIVETTARHDEYTVLTEDGNNHWGYGKIDAVAGLQACLNKTGALQSIINDSDRPVALIGSDDSHVSLLAQCDLRGVPVTVSNMLGMVTIASKIDARSGDIISLQIPRGVSIINVGGHIIKIK